MMTDCCRAGLSFERALEILKLLLKSFQIFLNFHEKMAIGKSGNVAGIWDYAPLILED